MKVITAALTVEKNKIATTSAWLTLIDLTLPDGTTVRYVPNPASVAFDGQTYLPFPLTINTVSSDLRGGLQDVEVTVSNITREISAFCEQQDLRGARVRLRGVNSANLADAAAVVFDEEYEITEIGVKEDVVTFRLGHERLLQQRFPAGLFLRDNCRHPYNQPAGRGPECNFTDDFTGPGTVSSAAATVTGVNTDFLTRFKPNVDSIKSGGQTRLVTAVATNLSLTVQSAPSPAWSSAAYTVLKPTCDKILEGKNGCRSHSNQARFGAFPGIPSVAGRFT